MPRLFSRYWEAEKCCPEMARHIAAAFNVQLKTVRGHERYHSNSHYLTRFWKNLSRYGERVEVRNAHAFFRNNFRGIEYTTPSFPDKIGFFELYRFPSRQTKRVLLALFCLSQDENFPYSWNLELPDEITSHEQLEAWVAYQERLNGGAN